jgi:hypothetical protein
VALPGLKLGGVSFDAHTLMVASMAVQLGFQAVAFAVLTTTYAINQRFRPPSRRVDRFFRLFTLERGGMAGLGLIVTGCLAVLAAVVLWFQVDFGRLEYAKTMRLVIPGTTAVILGASVIFNSFLCSMLGLDRK